VPAVPILHETGVIRTATEVRAIRRREIRIIGWGADDVSAALTDPHLVGRDTRHGIDGNERLRPADAGQAAMLDNQEADFPFPVIDQQSLSKTSRPRPSSSPLAIVALVSRNRGSVPWIAAARLRRRSTLPTCDPNTPR